MSKFEELCSAYKEYREGLSDVRMASFQFGTKLAYGYIEYLGASDEDFRLEPLNKVADKNFTYTVPGAMHLDDDAYWHLGFSLTLHISRNTYPKQNLIIDFMFKPISENVYSVGVLGIDGPFLNVDVNNDKDFEAVYEKIQDVIKSMYKNDFDYLTGKAHKLTTIGFVQSGIISDLNKDESK